jgi:transcriptional regulator with XRE-family HTH domain
MNIRLRLAILKGPRTQIRLARLTNIGEGRISKIVNGWQKPTEQERRAIAEALGKRVDELFGRRLEKTTAERAEASR